MYICISLYTCAFAQVYCIFSVSRSSKGWWLCQVGEPAADWGCQGARPWAEHPARGAVPHCWSKDSRAGLVAATGVSWESSERQTSLHGWGRSKVGLGSQVRRSGSSKCMGRHRHPCGGGSSKEDRGPEVSLLPALSPTALCVVPGPHAQGWGMGKRLQNLVVHSGSWRLCKNVELFQMVN